MYWKLICIALLAAALWRFIPLVVAAEHPQLAAPAAGERAAWTVVGERERLAREGGTPWSANQRRRAPALSEAAAPRD